MQIKYTKTKFIFLNVKINNIKNYYINILCRSEQNMATSDYEIIGGIGYGDDHSSNFDFKALLLKEGATENGDYPIKPWTPQPFAANGTVMTREPYHPIEQEPMGYNYRPDSVQYSEKSKNYYQYPKWNPNNPITGIEYEKNRITNGNALAVENAFQTETARYGGRLDINRTAGIDQAYNSYDGRTSLIMDIKNTITNAIGGAKEKMTDLADVDIGNTNIILIFMLFIVFVLIAYLQNNQINRLQNMLNDVLMRK